MKTYEKPKLIALSISGNSPLCSCTIDIVGDNMNPEFKETIGDFYPDTTKLFLANESCENKLYVEGYCKMAPNPTGLVFNS